jgi:hypothetical protein
VPFSSAERFEQILVTADIEDIDGVCPAAEPIPYFALGHR